MVGWPLRQAVRGWPPRDTVAVACDVGQGDALVWPAGAGAGVLVDTGPDVGAVDRCLDRLGIDTLPLVLLSHLDADHAGGLAGALAGRAVGVVATATLSPADTRVGALTGSSPAPARRGRCSSRATGEPSATSRSRSSPRTRPGPPPRPRERPSMVARLTVRGVSTLLTGDLGAETESRLVASGIDLRADVLKVPHHGSSDADPRSWRPPGPGSR